MASPTSSSRWRTIVTSAIAALLFAGCTSTSDSRTHQGDPDYASGRLIVHAAASLTTAFEEMAERFTTVAPDVDITFNFAGSSTLVAQLLEGAPADVVATADLVHMERLADASLLASRPAVFATNTAVIAVEKGNPFSVRTLADLARGDIKVVLCAPEVPCGTYARQILDKARVTLTPRSFEENVKAVVTKISLGEADAGIVYATDTASSAALDALDIDPALNIEAEYPVAVLKDATNGTAARAFIAFLASTEGRSILASHGFGTP